MKKTPSISFTQRGGGWVLAQLPVLVQAVAIPWWTGVGRFDPAVGWPLVGAVLVAVGFFITVAGLLTLGAALTPFPRPLGTASLRRQGIYRFLRHPVYAGMIYAACGWTLVWMSPVGILSAALTTVFFDLKARREELWLRQKYKDYDRYTQHVKKFLPGIY